MKLELLKRRLLALALLAAFAVTLFAPARSAEAAGYWTHPSNPQTGQTGNGYIETLVNWNGGPQ